MSKRFKGKNFLEINEADKEEFLRRLNIENMKVIFIASVVGIVFLFLLLYLDFLRYKSGKLPRDPVYFFLFINHLFFLFFIIPTWVITKNRMKIKKGIYKHARLLSYSWIIVCGIIILMMAILGLWDRGSVMLYAVFIFLLNFVIVLPHGDRITLNVVSFSVMLLAIIVEYNNNQELLIINILETLGVTIPAFIVSTYRYNNFVKQISSEKLLASKNEAITLEKKRSDDLLLNILPLTIADELKENGKVVPKYFEDTTIMFIDIVGFTLISKVLPPKQLVNELDKYFTKFDKIVDRYQLEKIKTVGDAYITVAGFNARPDHAIRTVKAAKEILTFTERWKKEKTEKSEPPYEVRIGIHTGPIVAGVVGLHKFAFDIWGDAVNIAARLEANGEIGKINISESTYQKIKDHFSCKPRGKVAIKNAGEIEMYFVN